MPFRKQGRPPVKFRCRSCGQSVWFHAAYNAEGQDHETCPDDPRGTLYMTRAQGAPTSFYSVEPVTLHMRPGAPQDVEVVEIPLTVHEIVYEGAPSTFDSRDVCTREECRGGGPHRHHAR